MTDMNKMTLPDKHQTIRVVPLPADTNAYGDIFGGWLCLKWTWLVQAKPQILSKWS